MPLCRFSDSTKTIIHLSGLRTSPYGSLYLAIDSYPLILFVINQQCSEQTGFLSLLSHSSKLTKSKEGIMGTSNVQQFCQKSRWQPWLTIGIWSEEQSCGNEPSTLMLTWVDSIRIELNCRTPTVFSCFFYDPVMLAIWSGSSAFSKSSLNISKFSVHVLLKPHLEDFEYYLASLWDECNCVAVWRFFGIAFLWDWNENWPFPVLWPSFPAEFSKFPGMLSATKDTT